VKYVSQVSGLSSSLSEVARGCKVSKEELSSVLNAEIRTRLMNLLPSVAILFTAYLVLRVYT
jgi:hypothetical protein